jgi:hypothetical protein
VAGAGHQRLAHTDQEHREEQCRQGAPIGGDGHGEEDEHGRSSALHGDDEAAAIHAIDHRAGGQGHQQPRQLGGHGHADDESRVVREMGGEQREGGQRQAVADAGDASTELNQPKGSAEPASAFLQRCRHPRSLPVAFRTTRPIWTPSGPGLGATPTGPDHPVVLVNRRSLSKGCDGRRALSDLGFTKVW